MFRTFQLGSGDAAATGIDPLDPNAGAGGGLRGRLGAPRSRLSPVPSTRSRRLRYPRGEGRGTRLPAPARQRRSARATGPHVGRNPDGSQSAQRTAAHPDGISAALQLPRGVPRVPEVLLQRIYQGSLALVNTLTGAGFGYGFGSVFTLGHHPHATGKVRTQPTPHHGHSRRGTIVAYNSGANTATVRFGDTPDSPTLNVPVSPMISATVMAAATMAAVHLWDAADPTDALITAVL